MGPWKRLGQQDDGQECREVEWGSGSVRTEDECACLLVSPVCPASSLEQMLNQDLLDE